MTFRARSSATRSSRTVRIHADTARPTASAADLKAASSFVEARSFKTFCMLRDAMPIWTTQSRQSAYNVVRIRGPVKATKP